MITRTAAARHRSRLEGCACDDCQQAAADAETRVSITLAVGMIRRARTLSGVAILLALAGAACALRGHPVAGIVIIAVAVAIGGLSQRLHLRKESHR